MKLSANPDFVNTNIEEYEVDLARVSRNFKVAVRALKKTKLRKPPLEQELSEHPRALAVVKKVLNDSNLVVDVIPR